MEWIIGDPRSEAAEAMDAAVDRDGSQIDACLAGLTVEHLRQLADDAHFLAECCEMAARSRS